WLARPVARERRILLVRYGPPVSAIGANRSGRAAAEELMTHLGVPWPGRFDFPRTRHHVSRTQLYRQQPGDFRKRIEQILRGRHAPGSRRVHLDTTGTRTWRVPFRTVEEHLKLYGEARHLSVARILAPFQIVRQVEGLGASTHRVRVEATGALWQAYQGTTDFNACHTCPTLVLLDGQLPSQITRNRGLQRHIVLEFSDCMLMPRAVNEVDMLVDEVVGREAFVAAVDH